MVKPIALQLYTLREECAKDFAGMLRQVADIGYRGVEFAGYHGMPVDELAGLCRELGLETAGAHVQLAADGDYSQALAEVKALGARCVATSIMPEDFASIDKIKDCAQRLQQAAAAFAQEGIAFGYHNHWWEFDQVEGQTAYDVLLAAAPDLKLELDIYWVAMGGADPAALLQQHGRRTPLVHIKDGPLDQPETPHTAVGQGKVDIAGAVNAIDEATTDWLIVELDHCATDMLTAVKQSYTYMTENNLAQGTQ